MKSEHDAALHLIVEVVAYLRSLAREWAFPGPSLKGNDFE